MRVLELGVQGSDWIDRAQALGRFNQLPPQHRPSQDQPQIGCEQAKAVWQVLHVLTGATWPGMSLLQLHSHCKAWFAHVPFPLCSFPISGLLKGTRAGSRRITW